MRQNIIYAVYLLITQNIIEVRLIQVLQDDMHAFLATVTNAWLSSRLFISILGGRSLQINQRALLKIKLNMKPKGKGGLLLHGSPNLQVWSTQKTVWCAPYAKNLKRWLVQQPFWLEIQVTEKTIFNHIFLPLNIYNARVPFKQNKEGLPMNIKKISVFLFFKISGN